MSACYKSFTAYCSVLQNYFAWVYLSVKAITTSRFLLSAQYAGFMLEAGILLISFLKKPAELDLMIKTDIS